MNSGKIDDGFRNDIRKKLKMFKVNNKMTEN